MKKFLYYFLNCTWGILMTIAGGAAALVLRIAGYRPQKWGPCLHFKVGKYWGGVSLGLVIITDTRPTNNILCHEFGHTLQNAMFGPFFILLVAIPSAIRYHVFNWRTLHGKENPDYDAIWFEGTATRWGTKHFPEFL